MGIVHNLRRTAAATGLIAAAMLVSTTAFGAGEAKDR